MRAPGLIASAILAATASIHLYWAFGGRIGKASAIPSKDGVPVIRPSALGTAIVGMVLFAAALLVAVVAGPIATGIPTALLKGGAALLVFAFGLRAIGDFRYVGFFKRVTGSRFATLDTWFYSPLCLLLAVLIGAAASV